MGNSCIIFPEKAFRRSWDFIGFVFTVVQSIFIPFEICFDFEPSGVLEIFVLIMDAYFVLDLGKECLLL